MTESFRNTSDKSGLPPGSLIHIGTHSDPTTNITVINYGIGVPERKQIQTIDELLDYTNSDSKTWVIIEGLTDITVVEQIGKLFDIHDLVLEDILNTHQRPKFEQYDDHLFIVLKCLILADEGFAVDYEQISLLLIKNTVFMFKEKQDRFFEPLQQRILSSKGKLHNLGTDYLSYLILDYIVDQNFILIDSLDDVINSLEDSVFSTEPTPEMLYKIQGLKREMISIRRYISPIRELLNAMMRSDSDLIDKTTHLYLRDLSDHATRIVESIEYYREILTGLLEIYISNLSNKMNEVMKILTVFASIFIPLTFLTGIYGMNFDYMPELQWKWAYPLLWVIFFTLPVGLLIYFKKKKWL